jgi:hydroxypyruvate isomerase
MPIKQGFSWWCYAGHGVGDKELLQAAKKIGYPAVDIPTSDIWDLAVDTGLELSSIPGHKLEKKGLNDPKNHDEIEKTIMGNLEIALKYKIPNLIVFSGERGQGISDEAGAENTAIGLKRVAKAAEDAGVMIVLELLNSKVDHGGYMCDTSAWGIEVCKAVDSPKVKLLYDIYHMQIMEGDIMRTIKNHHQWFGHYHTGGNPGRNDIDETQELYYPPIVKAINDTGFNMYMAHEFVPKGDPVAALKHAFDLCNL